VKRALAIGLAVFLLLPQAALAAESGETEPKFDPSHEFELPAWVDIHLGPLDMSINKAVVYLWLAAASTMALGLLLMRVKLRLRPDRRQTIGEQIYDVAQTQVAEQGLPSKAIGRWFPYVASLMLFIWVTNMLGFIPLPITGETFEIGGVELPVWGIYAATSSISVTLALAFLTWIFQHIEGIRYNGPIKYFRSWIPEVPKALLPLIVPIEIISQFMRLISLSVRLYANMLAGHILILTMIGLVFIVHTPPWRFFGLPAAFVFYIFEVVIVVTIQAFIFAALSAIYIGSAIEPEH
jgi:F-type H+-transporting ATPase subunit a